MSAGKRGRPATRQLPGLLVLASVCAPPAAGAQTVNSVTQYSYDSVGRLQCTAVRMNPATFENEPSDACTPGKTGSYGQDRITMNVYDAAGQLTQVIKGYRTPLQQAYATYAYSADGKQTDVIDANGNHAQMSYDGFDRLQKWSFPSKTLPENYSPSTVANAFATAGAVDAADYEQYGYDPNGNRTSLRKRDGQTIGYTYDALNRVTVKIQPVGSSVFYDYDLQGHLLDARFGSLNGAGIANTYDGFGRLMTTTTDQSGTALQISHEYDANSNRTRVTHPDKTFFTYDYDGLDRLKSISESGVTPIVGVTYNAQGVMWKLVRGGITTTYGYDGILRLNSIADDMAGTNGDETEALTYNPANQIFTDGKSNDAYAFNAYANISRKYGANGLNQYATAGSATFSYDANGNLTSARDSMTGSSSTYTYDPENRLLTAAGLASAVLTYDPLGRLYQVAGPSGTTRFLYDGDELVAEYNGSNTLLRRFVHGNEEDDPLIWYEGSAVSAATRRSLEDDHQGSIISVADASGNLIRANSYDEYGIPGTSNLGRFQYTGQAWMPELGLNYYKARMYSPSLGRFMQIDPIGYKDQINLYAYVANDPIDGTDPSGDQTVTGSENLTPDDFRKLRTLIVEHPGETMQVVGTAVSMIPTPATEVGGRAVEGAGTVVRNLDGENVAGGAASTLKPGPHAGESVPASGPKITPGEQQQINRIGETSGCHTCGATTPGTKSGNWVGDHQPPNKLNPPGGKQELYPHCLGCSRRQGGQVNKVIQQIQSNQAIGYDE